MPTTPCRVCGAEANIPRWTVRGGYDWAECPACHSLILSNPPTASDFDGIYNDEYYQSETMENGSYPNYIGERPFIQGNLKRRVDWALRHMQRGAGQTWLDVGCAAGFLLDVVRGYGYAPYGLDYADFGPRFARQELGMPNARQGTLDSVPTDFPSQFNVISFMDVLEHLPVQRHSLRQAAERLAPGGYLIGETFLPQSATARIMGQHWHAIDPPNHLAILSPEGIEQTLSEAGLRRVAQVRLPRWVSFSHLAVKFGKPGKRLALRLEHTALGRWGIPVTLHDAALWVYQKQA